MSAAAVVAVALGGFIVTRVAVVCNRLRRSDMGGRTYLAWEAFGLSYCVVAVAAGGSAWQIAHGCGSLGDWGWLIGSAGLIAFDRRREWQDPKRETT